MDLKFRTSVTDIETVNVIKWASDHMTQRRLRPLMEAYHPHRNSENAAPTSEFSRLVERMLERADAVGVGCIPDVDPLNRKERVVNALWYHVAPAMDGYCPTPFSERIQECVASFWTDLQKQRSSDQVMATA